MRHRFPNTLPSEDRRARHWTTALCAVLLVGLAATPALADITLTDYPQEMVAVDEYVTVSWQENVRCRLAYGRLPGVYTTVTDVDGWQSLGFTPESEGMTPGVYYCVVRVDGTGETSDEFVLVVESPIFPTPRTPVNGGVVTSTTTTFSWEPVMGVPFYHVIVSDHPIEVEENEEGDLVITGANVIWQAITGNTSIQFGAPDPSGHFTETNGTTPPLVQDFEYNWLVLNNFGNHPLMTSVAGAGIAGFTVDVDVAFDPPVLVSPPPNVEIAEEFLVFDWEPVAGASSYHLYLYEERTWDAGDASYPVWDGATNDTSLEVNLGNFLVSGNYSWRVLALDATGRGRPSELRSFEYVTETGTAHIVTERETGGALPRVLVEIERSDSGLEALPVITNQSGIFNRDLAPGVYDFHASRTDYADTTVTCNIVEDETRNVLITMRRAPARVRGFVRDEGGAPVFGADVTGTNGVNEAGATTDIRGSFVLDVTSGPWDISASKTGYAPSETTSVEPAAGDYLELPDPLVLIGTPGFASGSVVNAGGSPIIGATVRASSPSGDVVGASGAGGHFRLELAPSDWSITAEKSGFVPSDERIVTVPPGTETAVEPPFSLLPVDSAVLGSVTDGSFGVAGATVVATPPSGAPLTTETNTRGEFVLLPPPGTYSLMARHEDFCPSALHQVTVETGASFTGIELIVGAPDCVFEGRVSDGTSPVDGAVVSAGVVETTTAPDGTFALGLPSGVHELRARKTEHASGTPLTVAAGAGQTIDGLDLRVTPGAARVTGTVEATEGPVAFATVEALSRGARVVTRTDAAGAFELALESGVWEVSAWKRGFTPSPAETLELGPGQVVGGVMLTPTPTAVRLHGTVSDGVDVVRRAKVLFYEPGTTEPSRMTSSGSNGGYEVLLEAGLEYQMVVRADGHGEDNLSVGPFAAESVHEIDIVLPVRSGLLEGRVTGQGGLPVGGALVRSADTGASTRADGRGLYALWLVGGSHDIVVSAPGYLPRAFPDTDVPTEGSAALDCSLNDVLGTVAGAVTDSLTSEPVPGALTTIVWSGGGRTSVTGAGGAFRLDDVVPGDARVLCSCPGFRPKVLEVSVDDDEWLELDIELFRYSGSITGTVTRGDGVTPVEEANVRASDNGIVVSATTSAADGGFALGGLDPDSTYDVSVTRSGYYAATDNPQEDVAPGTTDLVFGLEPSTGTIGGAVTDAVSSEPIQGATVAVDHGAGYSGVASTGEDGTFVIAGLPPVSGYTATARAYGYHDAVADSISAAAGTIDLELARNFARLEGHLTALGDVDVTDISIVATNTSYAGYSRTEACPASGDYAIDEVRPGSYVVTVSGDGCLGAPLQMTVQAGEGETVSGLDFTVERPPVEAIEISGPSEVGAGETVTFSGYSVTDEGQLVDTALEWWVSPPEAGAIARGGGVFEASAGYIGEARIGAYEPVSGLRGSLDIAAFVRVGPTSAVTAEDSLGARLEIPVGSVSEEQTIHLAHETLPDAKRLGRDYEVSETSYHLMPDGLEFDGPAMLSVPSDGGRLVLWNEDRLAWETVDSAAVGGDLEASIAGLGEYAVSRTSRGLAVWDIVVRPNPFSPDEGPVSIRFDVSSSEARMPFVTLRIRNIQGQLVRTVVENEPTAKGEAVVEWDGNADSGRPARNGRYVIEIIAEDAGAEETSLGTVVLVK
ncbi:MAG: hypothetical protein GF405_09480 [Candidatus Eisenbacteria bacterium]|nr:hypothetical protein [Candidatus Eisenbacteria bacterium]